MLSMCLHLVKLNICVKIILVETSFCFHLQDFFIIVYNVHTFTVTQLMFTNLKQFTRVLELNRHRNKYKILKQNLAQYCLSREI